MCIINHYLNCNEKRFIALASVLTIKGLCSKVCGLHCEGSLTDILRYRRKRMRKRTKKKPKQKSKVSYFLRKTGDQK